MKNIIALSIINVMFLAFFSMNTKAQQAAAPPVHLPEQNTMSVLWFQTSGEAKALYYQGYNIGKMRLKEYLNSKIRKKRLKPAVILDIDETIIDNSPQQAWNIKKGKENPLSWSGWVNLAKAKPLPGAVDFLKYANSMGIDIYYISNRKETKKAVTIRNLQQIGAPQAVENHVLLRRPNERGKETRRTKVAETHDIILLFGDNLGDFSGFDNLPAAERIEAAESRKEEFGKKLIVFPNPMYGDWEGAIYNNNSTLSDAQKDKLRKEGLQP